MNTAIILRCPPSKTREIFLWAKDEHPGLIWAPFITRSHRLPRRRVRTTTTTAAMPGYLFMTEAHGPLARTLAALESHSCKPMWTPEGFFARCAMEELFIMHQTVSAVGQKLRGGAAEPRTPTFAPGSTVEIVPGEHFLAGLRGMVVAQDGEEVQLQTQGFWHTLKISAWLLRAVGI